MAVTTKRRVGILVFDGVGVLDVAGPAQVFSQQVGGVTSHDVSLCSVDGSDIVTASGIRLGVDVNVANAPAFDTIVVAGGYKLPRMLITNEYVDAVHSLASRARRVASICTGAFILAEAGLLDGRRVTTHWMHTTALQRRYPSLQVDPDAIFVKDGSTYTSAGVTAGIDLCLALLEEDVGSEHARQIARTLVVFMQRPGGQSQFSALLETPPPSIPHLRDLIAAITAAPAENHSLESMAARACVSTRHLTRLFREELGTTAVKYVETVRFEVARALLDGGHPVLDAAVFSGFGSAQSLRRAFRSRLGITPRDYQLRFQTATRCGRVAI